MKFIFCFLGIPWITCQSSDLPIVITTWGSDGFVKATENAVSARNSGGRMFGLVSGLSTCEALQCDTTVGFAGSPDENGETCLDSLVIDSVGMRMGAVANLHRIRDAAKVAWAVMNYTKHTILVGESATNFAKQMGFKEEDLSSDQTKKWITDWKEKSCQPNFWQNVQPSPASSCGPYKPDFTIGELTTETGFNVEVENHDTIGMVVRDSNNKTAAGTSSNGARFKISGRVGDSPIPGAGAYATVYGGAAATGDGDVMMRFLPSFHVMEQIELGSKPSKATIKTIRKILKSYPKFQGGVVALDVHGRFGAACANMPEFQFVLGYANGTSVVNKMKCLSKNKLQ